jgi:hypothetical protein
MSVMGNVYSASSSHGPSARLPSQNDADTDWDDAADTERVALIEENARLRALVVQLSTLVLRNVVDQHNSPQLVPFRRPRLD